MTENNFCTCPTCGHKHRAGKREIAIYKGLAMALWNVYKWCLEKGIHEFAIKDVNHLIGQIGYSRFNDLPKFGGLVYRREKKSHYGLNMERCDEFFKNKLSVPSRILKDTTTGELTMLDYKFMRDIPKLAKFLDGDGMYISRYLPRDGQTLL